RRRTLAYDDAGRKTLETWYNAGGTVVYDTLTFTYDSNGNQLTAANAAGVQTQAYDALDRVTQSDQLTGVTQTFTYDLAGNRTLVADSKSGVQTSIYDAAHQLVQRAELFQKTSTLTSVNWTDFFYDSDGRVVRELHRTASDLDALWDDSGIQI